MPSDMENVKLTSKDSTTGPDSAYGTTEAISPVGSHGGFDHLQWLSHLGQHLCPLSLAMRAFARRSYLSQSSHPAQNTTCQRCSHMPNQLGFHLLEQVQSSSDCGTQDLGQLQIPWTGSGSQGDSRSRLLNLTGFFSSFWGAAGIPATVAVGADIIWEILS
jgi:hypothetical protein